MQVHMFSTLCKGQFEVLVLLLCVNQQKLSTVHKIYYRFCHFGLGHTYLSCVTPIYLSKQQKNCHLRDLVIKYVVFLIFKIYLCMPCLTHLNQYKTEHPLLNV